MRTAVWLAIAALAAPASAKADQPPPVYGFGGTTCATYIFDLAAHRDEARKLYFSWAQGFITAANALMAPEAGMAPTLLVISADDQQRFLDDICRASPAMEFSRAAMKLLDKIRAAHGLTPVLKN